MLKSPFTNLVDRDADGNVIGLMSDFNMVDTIVQAEFDTGRDDYPLRLLAEYLRNTKAASSQDTGIWFEAQYGGSRTVDTYTLGYTYGWMQQEASLSPFVFSDMLGTNVRLHMLNLAYNPLANLSLDLTLHFFKRLEVETGMRNNWLARPHGAAIIRF